MEMTLVGAAVGLLVGLTGTGGGALMTPALILFFGVNPVAAISSDLVATLVMRPFGVAVHARRGTVAWGIVGWLTAGSVPAAFAGASLLDVLRGHTVDVERILGGALVVGAGAMAVRWAAFSRNRTVRPPAGPAVRAALTAAVGAAGGFLVGATSVGAGSLMAVLLGFVYPSLRASELVATDLAQAIPLGAAAAAGAAVFGHVVLHVVLSVVVGAVPGVVVGSLLSSRAPESVVRPAVFTIILAAGLRYLGVTPAGVLAGASCAAVLAGVALACPRWQSSRARREAEQPA